MRPRYACGVLLAFVIGALPNAAHAGGKGSSADTGVVGIGAQLLRLDDGCAVVDGRVTSGDFFENLKRYDIGGRLEYKKRGFLVTQYPDSVMASIRIVGDKCGPALSNSPSSIFEGGSYALKFQLEWKDGMQLRPATLFPAVAHCVGYSSIILPRGDARVPSITCQMTVESKGVPLLDHLIVSVFVADGNQLTRLSAAP